VPPVDWAVLVDLSGLAPGRGLGLGAADVESGPGQGWLNWRGPEQNGWSSETGLPERVVLNGTNHLWTADFPGKSTPVIANGRLYVMGYVGEGPDLQEGIACFDAETGKRYWQHLANDYLSRHDLPPVCDVQPDDRS